MFFGSVCFFSKSITVTVASFSKIFLNFETGASSASRYAGQSFDETESPQAGSSLANWNEQIRWKCSTSIFAEEPPVETVVLFESYFWSDSVLSGIQVESKL